MELRCEDREWVTIEALREHVMGDTLIDQRDIEIAEMRAKARRRFRFPLQGDVVLLPGYSVSLRDLARRVAYVWWEEDGTLESIQPTPAGMGGSFHLNADGRGSMSGGLDPEVKGEAVEDTGGWSQQPFWFFHNNFSGAGRGVTVFIPVRVWRIVASV